MRRIFRNGFVLFFTFSALISCRETPPSIDYSVKVDGLVDTSFVMSTPPAPVNIMIYVEDLTGVKCPNCPIAAEKVHSIDTSNKGKVVSIAAYPFALSHLTAPWSGFLVLNTNESDEIFANIYSSPSQMPIGSVNRRVFAGETGVNTSYNKWTGYANSIKTEESPIYLNPKIESIDTVNHKLKVSVELTFTKKYDEPINMTLYFVESKLISKQSMPGSLPPKDDYVHNHVLRKSITPYNGIQLKVNGSIAGNYEVGRTFIKEFELTYDSKWKIQNSAIVILANRHDAISKEVLQAAQLHL